MTASNYLFVYGTLRRGSMNEMSRLLATHANLVDFASYQGKLYIVDGYPGVIASGCPTDCVHGEIYRLHHPAISLPIFDKYEECGIAYQEPTEYVRKIQPVRLRDDMMMSAWIYLYNKSTAELSEVLSGDFLKSENS